MVSVDQAYMVVHMKKENTKKKGAKEKDLYN